MKLQHAALALALVAPMAACASGPSHPRTMELPGGGPSEPQAQQAHDPNFVERMMGVDNRQNAGPCPLMGVLYDTSRLVEFNPADTERYANITYTGEMRGVRGLCRYVGADPIEMAVDVDMAFGRGPASTGARKTYRYWVAVARRGIAPLAKQYFTVDVDFPRDQAVVTHTEHIERIVIPRANDTISGENFEILVGFDLTPAQLQFNRDGKRFRIDAPDRAAAQGQ